VCILAVEGIQDLAVVYNLVVEGIQDLAVVAEELQLEVGEETKIATVEAVAR